MSTTLLLALALFTQPKRDADESPVALHRNIEIDDLDRERRRLHDTVLFRRGLYLSTQRMYQRGLISHAALEKASTDLRYAVAHEAETAAHRALKEHERDVLGGIAKADDAKASALVLDWLRKQEEMDRIDLGFREYHLKQTRALVQRKLATREELEDVALEYNTAQSSLALNLSRQAKLAMEQAARPDEKGNNAADLARLKTDYLKARVVYFEILASGAKDRLVIAMERSRRGLIPAAEIALFQKNADEAISALAGEQARLDQSTAAAPAPLEK